MFDLKHYCFVTFQRKTIKGKLSSKTRFRALVRQVISNRPWLAEAVLPKKVDKVIKEKVLEIEVTSREKYQSLSLAVSEDPSKSR